jgi:hypothetical protein
MAPQNDTDFSGNAVMVDLSWGWDGALADDEWFQVEIKLKSPPSSSLPDGAFDVSWVKKPVYSFNAAQGNRTYIWTVSVMRGNSPKPKEWSSPCTVCGQAWDPAPTSESVSKPSETRTLSVKADSGAVIDYPQSY